MEAVCTQNGTRGPAGARSSSLQQASAHLSPQRLELQNKAAQGGCSPAPLSPASEQKQAGGAGPQKRPPQCQVTGVRLSGRVTASSSPGTSDCRQADSSLPAAGTRRRAWLHGGWARRCLVLDAPPGCRDTQHLRGGLQKEEEHRAARVCARKDPAPGLNLALRASHGPLSAGDQAISTVQGMPGPPS